MIQVRSSKAETMLPTPFEARRAQVSASSMGFCLSKVIPCHRAIFVRASGLSPPVTWTSLVEGGIPLRSLTRSVLLAASSWTLSIATISGAVCRIILTSFCLLIMEWRSSLSPSRMKRA